MKKTVLIVLIMVCLLFLAAPVRAEGESEQESFGSLLELYDLEDIDRKVEEEIGEYSFSGLVQTFLEGDFEECVKMMKHGVREVLLSQWMYHKYTLLKILLLGILSALFSNLSLVLNKTEISETGFFFTYLLMMTLLVGAFHMMCTMLSDVTEKIFSFVQLMIPALVLSVGLSSGQATALGFGELALTTIYVGEAVIQRILLPLIKFYVIFNLINHIFPEDYLSRLGGLCRGFVLWFLKVFLGIVMGMNIIKGMILPGMDEAGKSTAMKLVSLIPGAEGLNSAGSIFLSAAKVIKNAMGGAAIVILLLVILVPLVQMLLFVGAYKLTSALLQPFADKRISGCVDVTAEGVILLNKVLITQFVMLSLSLAVICIVTT